MMWRVAARWNGRTRDLHIEAPDLEAAIPFALEEIAWKVKNCGAIEKRCWQEGIVTIINHEHLEHTLYSPLSPLLLSGE